VAAVAAALAASNVRAKTFELDQIAQRGQVLQNVGGTLTTLGAVAVNSNNSNIPADPVQGLVFGGETYSLPSPDVEILNLADLNFFADLTGTHQTFTASGAAQPIILKYWLPALLDPSQTS
jgi:hypothetical protein